MTDREFGFGANFINLLQDPANTIAVGTFGQLLEALPSSVVLMTFDNTGKPRQAWLNSNAARLLGETPETLLRTPTPERWARWLHPSDLATYKTAYERLLLNGGSSEQVFRILDLESRHDGNHTTNYLWITENRSILIDPLTGNVTSMLSVLQDTNRIGRFAYEDALTGLRNRRYLEEYWPSQYHFAQRSKGQQALMGVILCDVDHLKLVNDNGGHLNGDNAIISTADFLKSKLRDYDTAIRWGGDEFLVLNPGSNRVNTRGLATRLHADFEKANFQIGEIPLTISIGFHSTNLSRLTMEPTDALDLLIKRADVALYEAKAEGRNRVREYKYRG